MFHTLKKSRIRDRRVSEVAEGRKGKKEVEEQNDGHDACALCQRKTTHLHKEWRSSPLNIVR